MTTRFLLTVALALFAAVQGLHAECWFSCDDARRPAALACHQTGMPGPALSDAHDCATHAPLAALTVERTTHVVMHVSMAAFLPPASRDAGSAPLRLRTDGLFRPPGRHDLISPLRN